MANIQGLKDFYNWATTKPETKPMAYAPPVNKQSSDVGASFGGYSKPAAQITTPQSGGSGGGSSLTGDWYKDNDIPDDMRIKESTTGGDNLSGGGGGAGVGGGTDKKTSTKSVVYIEREQPDPMDYINEMKEAQRRSRLAALDKAKGTALGALDTEQANVSPIYYDKRNQAAAASDVGAMNFAQYMAARGIKGAAGAMPEIYRQAGLQGQIGALDRQEAGNLAAIERQRANVESGYASDVAAANADIEAQAMQAAINQYNQNRQYGLQEAGLTGSLGDSRTLAGQEFDYSRSPSNPAVQAQIYANKQRELEIAAQEIQNSYLPDTLKLQAQRLAQEVKAGTLDYDTALANLNQIKAQTNSTNALATQRNTPADENMSAYRTQARSIYNNGYNPEDSKAAVINYAESLQNAGVPESTIRQLLIEFGISV